MEGKMEGLQPEIDRISTFHPALLKLIEAGEEQAKKARKKALRILIPFVIIACLVLIGIGILIGKYIL